MSREAIRAAIRGEPVPKGALAGFDEVPGDPADRGPGGRRDRLVLPPPAEGPDATDNPFPSEAELLKRPPVWERAMRRLPVATAGAGATRRAAVPRTGERQRRLLGLGVLIAIIALLGGGLWFATRERSSGSGAAATTAPAPTLVRVRPSGVSASSQSGSRVAANVIDDKLGTFWSRLVPSQDNQPFLRFSFDRPVRLGRIQIAAGAAGAEFSKRPRPQEIELQFSDGTTLRTTLADRAGFQTVNFRPREIDRVRLVVRSTYPSSGPQRTSVTEVRFFAVKS